MKYSLLVFAIGALTVSGCVHSYYALEVNRFKDAAADAAVQCVGNESRAIDTVWVETHRTLFYADDFSYCKRHGDGDWFYYVKEGLCRFPTVLIEVPFWFLNRSFRYSMIGVEAPDDSGLENGNAIVRADIPWWRVNGKVPVHAVTNSLDSTGLSYLMVELAEVEGTPEDESPRSKRIMKYIRNCGDTTEEIPLGECSRCDYVYFTGRDECYVLKELRYKTLSFCGIAIDDDAPVPFVWRIDLRTGRREPVAWLDRGKIVYASKDKKRDAEGQ